MKTFVLLLPLMCLMMSLRAVGLSEKTASQKKAKNVILFIGDGMGPTVLQATRFQFYGVRGKLNVDSFPSTAKVKTYARDRAVTDSAAGGTAMATGYKVPSGSISIELPSDFKQKKLPSLVKSPKNKDYETILELAAKHGKRVGVVTTTEITDATPAAFYAHTAHRRKTKEVIEDLAKSPIHLLMGGGWKKTGSI